MLPEKYKKGQPPNIIVENRARGGGGGLEPIIIYREPRMPKNGGRVDQSKNYWPLQESLIYRARGMPRVATSQNSDMNHTQEIILRNAARKGGLEEQY